MLGPIPGDRGPVRLEEGVFGEWLLNLRNNRLRESNSLLVREANPIQAGRRSNGRPRRQRDRILSAAK